MLKTTPFLQIILTSVLLMACVSNNPSYMTAQDQVSMHKKNAFDSCAAFAAEQDREKRTYTARLLGRFGDVAYAKRFNNSMNECMRNKGYSDFDITKKNHSINTK